MIRHCAKCRNQRIAGKLHKIGDLAYDYVLDWTLVAVIAYAASLLVEHQARDKEHTGGRCVLDLVAGVDDVDPIAPGEVAVAAVDGGARVEDAATAVDVDGPADAAA